MIFYPELISDAVELAVGNDNTPFGLQKMDF